MAWFARQKPGVEGTAEADKRVRTEGLWLKCESCGQIIWKKTLDDNMQVCPKCEHHFRLDARARLAMLFDDGIYEELDAELVSTDPLNFEDSKTYAERLEGMQRATGISDALISGYGTLEGRRVHICAMELKFIGGSMGAVVGEKITRAIERATEKKVPVVIVSASGGARMYEGIHSLMQMAKTSAALARHAQARLPYVSILTDPTMAGVMASFATLGDVIIAEPRARIGFAGPRVIEETTKQELPQGFQTAEFLLEHGLIDLIVSRLRMKVTVAQLLRAFANGNGNGHGKKNGHKGNDKG